MKEYENKIIRDESNVLDQLYDIVTKFHDYIVDNNAYDKPGILTVYDSLLNTYFTMEDDGY